MTSVPHPPAPDGRQGGFARPEWVCAAVAVIVRSIAVWAQWTGNPVHQDPRLDALYYLNWAREVAAGAVWSAGPVGASEPYLLNPLYAWCMAPLTVFGDGLHLATLVLQVLLGGATTWLAAAAARRHGARLGNGSLAAWIAGAGIAFSGALVHLSTHVSVATLAAFLIAGTLFACAPSRADAADGTRGSQSGVAAGIWLGLGALARPVTLLAIPFVAWLYKRRTGPRAAIVVIAIFVAFTAVSFVRNVAVSGEAVPFTAANGLNLHLGQNPMARQTNAMLTGEFQFNPITMHDDARVRVGHELGRHPSRSEVSAWFRDATIADMRANPGAAFGHAANKLRWFASPEEPASSADMGLDRRRVPWLYVGFLPTWLIVVLGIAGAWVARKDRDLLLGAGGLVLAHVVSTTLAFPLSHYRAPAIPALCVLAGVGIAALLQRERREQLIGGALVVVLTALAWIPPQPREVDAMKYLNSAVDALRAHDLDDATRYTDLAGRALPQWAEPFQLRAQICAQRGQTAEALSWMDQVVARRPWDLDARRIRAELLVDLKRPEEARAAAEALVADLPWHVAARGIRGSIRAYTNDLDGARDDLRWAMERGYWPRSRVLELTGLRRPE